MDRWSDDVIFDSVTIIPPPNLFSTIRLALPEGNCTMEEGASNKEDKCKENIVQFPSVHPPTKKNSPFKSDKPNL